MTCCSQKVGPYFKPNYNFKALTEKFYARHEETNKVLIKEYEEVVERHSKIIEKRQRYDERKHRLAPITENQLYGWLEYLTLRSSTGYDHEILWHPKKTDPDMQIQLGVMVAKRREYKFGR